VFQRRVDGSVDFYRNWQSYKVGFGELDHEFWLGNDKLYYLTNQGDYQLRIDMVNRDGAPYYAKFDLFRINDEMKYNVQLSKWEITVEMQVVQI
ncbi:fibrinogen-like protein A, partial [Apostichopus japonicus]